MTGRVLPNWSDSFFLRRSLTPSLSIASMKRCVNCREWIDGIKERLQICEPGSPAAKAFLLDYFFLPSPNNEMKSQTIEKQSQIEHIEIRERPCSVEFDRVSVIDRLSLSLSLSLDVDEKELHFRGGSRIYAGRNRRRADCCGSTAILFRISMQICGAALSITPTFRLMKRKQRAVSGHRRPVKHDGKGFSPIRGPRWPGFRFLPSFFFLHSSFLFTEFRLSASLRLWRFTNSLTKANRGNIYQMSSFYFSWNFRRPSWDDLCFLSVFFRS